MVARRSDEFAWLVSVISLSTKQKGWALPSHGVGRCAHIFELETPSASTTKLLDHLFNSDKVVAG
ncbi:hypothetical protein BOW25_04675 [Solemya velum gill symbiont]|nr:hypothetical protein BOW25_04675 [Solemya velum gill symbiont]